MAEVISINGQEYKRRSPFGVWILVIVTVGIYLFVWYYKVHDEAKRYLRDDSIKPGLMTLSIIIPIWGWITFYQLGDRHVARMQRTSGNPPTMSAVLGTILYIFVSGTGIIYYQSELNKVWDAAKAQALTQLPAAPAGGKLSRARAGENSPSSAAVSTALPPNAETRAATVAEAAASPSRTNNPTDETSARS
jgi:Domain of unknown function (DUF4234)